MLTEGTISEAVAVKQAGVSARTLQRFSEAGYLTVQVKNDGERYYSCVQLHEIFGTFQESCATTVAIEEPSEPETVQSERVQSETVQSETVQSETVQSERVSRTACQANYTTYYSSVEETPIVERVAPVSPSRPTPHPTESVATTLQGEDYLKLKNLVALQERILDMKDSEIQDLRSQRDWLRTRVEKLEEKGDRDQVLLLSETQALRQLIGLQQKRPSTVRNLLEWLGLGSSEPLRALPSNEDMSTATTSHGTIVMNKAANG